MSLFPRAEDLKKVRIGGSENEYLSEVTEDTNLRNALSCKGNVDERDFRSYLLSYNIGKVEDIIISKQSTYTIKKLSKEESMIYNTLVARMEEAIIYAKAYWENEVFFKIMNGKYSFEKS